MKNVYTLLIFLLTLTVMLVPLSSLPKGHVKTVVPAAAEPTETEPEKEEQAKVPELVRLYDETTKKVKTVDMKDYLFSVVAAECPMSYADEALKAQIVAAHTFTLYRIKENAKEKYDVSTNPETAQAYLTVEQIKKNWGTNYEKYAERLEKLIDENYKYIALYDGEPILAVYHAISAGKTEDCKNVWASDLPYLKAVDSKSDKLASGYLSEQKVTKTTAETKLKELGFSLEGLTKGEQTKSDSGNMLKITYKGKSITGGQIQKAFDLRSQNFDYTYKNNMLLFTVRGYGHQAGMSQTGANYMANDGKTFDEILKHYYKGIIIGEIE